MRSFKRWYYIVYEGLSRLLSCQMYRFQCFSREATVQVSICPMAAMFEWHQNHRYLSSYITVWILAPFLLFWFVKFILLNQPKHCVNKISITNQNNKKGSKIQIVMKELKYLWFWCHSNMDAIGNLEGRFSSIVQLIKK